MSGWPVFWYQGQVPPWWARVLASIYCMLVLFRKAVYQYGWLAVKRAPVPILVVGNRVVGGSGKTPLLLALIPVLQQAGIRVGVISRGYGRSTDDMRRVTAESGSDQVGDEPLLLFQQLSIPVFVSRDRVEAARALSDYAEIDLIVSDDGWQHYAMDRQWVVEVMNAKLGYGNGYCLPAGPLREPTDSLPLPNIQLVNGVDFALRPMGLRQLSTGTMIALDNLPKQVVAVAGIGQPHVFFDDLQKLGFQLISSLPLKDHQALTEVDFTWDKGEFPVIMTAKDAVRCQAFAKPHWWVLEVESVFDAQSLADKVLPLVQTIKEQLKHG